MSVNNNKSFGDGVHGAHPALIGGGYNSTGMVGSSARGRARLILREGYGNYSFLTNLGVISPGFKTGLTPFRQAFNAGDITLSVNSGPHPNLPRNTQINGINTTIARAKGDAINKGTAAFSGNPKYVYDSSDYTKFRYLKATLNNYNDKSFGGSNNGQYTFITHARH